MRFLTIVGARPQFIKASPLSVELRKQHEEFLVHTGQHYDDNMSDVFFRELKIPAPDRHLGVGSGSHGKQTGDMLARIEDVLLEIRPDAVIVYGDTNSTLAGALAAAKLHIPVAHVEAGLRSFNRDMPEEINRIVTDHLSRWLFAPSQSSVDLLAKEGITDNVYNVGDVMADCVRLFGPLAKQHSTILERLELHPGEYCVATVHRAENTDNRERLTGILTGLAQIPHPVVIPLHPRTKAAVERHQLVDMCGASCVNRDKTKQLLVVDPLGYLDMLQLQQNAAMVLTDSGGIQKEAYYLGVPCVTLREETEWVETVEAGRNRLVGADPTKIEAAALAYQSYQSDQRRRPDEHPILYGDGHAAEKIVEILSNS